MASVEYKSNYYKNKTSGTSNDVPTQTYKSNYYKNKSAQQNATQTPKQMAVPTTGKVTKQQAIDMTRKLVGNPAGSFAQPKANIDTWVQPDYKLSKEEKEQAKEYYKAKKKELDKYFRNSSRKDVDTAVFKQKQDEYMQLETLQNKTSGLKAFLSGFVKPNTDIIATGAQLIAATEDGKKAANEAKANLSTQNSSAKTQHAFAHGAGYLTGQVANYKAGSEIAGLIPGLNAVTATAGNAIGTGIGKLTGGKIAAETAAKAATNILGDTVLDFALDTLPEMLTNIQEGKEPPKIAQDAVKNIAVNMGFNLGGEAVSQVFDILKAKRLAKLTPAQAKKEVEQAVNQVLMLPREGDVPRYVYSEPFTADTFGNVATKDFDFNQKVPSVQAAKKTLEDAENKILDVATKRYKHSNLSADTLINNVARDLGIDLNKLQRDVDTAEWFETLSKEEKELLLYTPKATEINTPESKTLFSKQMAANKVVPKIEPPTPIAQRMSNTNLGNNAVKSATSIPNVDMQSFGKNTVGAAEQNKNSYSHMVNEFGQIDVGENPFREVDVPKSTDGADRVSRFTRTAMEAKATPEELIPEYEKAVTEGIFSYDIKTDKSAMNKALSDIEDFGFQTELARWNKLVDDGKQVGKEDVVKAQMLYTAAANAGDTETAMKLAADIAHQATNAGQTAQAMRLLKKMTPEGKLYYAQKSVDRLQKELVEKYGKNMPDLKLDPTIADELLHATDEKATQQALTKLYQSIADQLPSTFADKFEAWRYLAMLGNTRTQIRNVLANVVSVPLRFFKNEIQAVTESSLNGILKATGNEGIERTRALLRPGKEQINFAKNDYDIAKGLIDGGGKYQDGKNIINQMRDPFKINGNWGKTANSNIVAKGARATADVAMGAVSKFNKLNNAGLELGDQIFSKGAYVDALSNYMRANGLKDTDMVGETLIKARAHAVKEAQEAVFREANSLATMLNRMENKNKLTKLVIGGTVPFKKTPLNIAKRGIEFSPIGLVKGVTDALFNVKSGKKTATEAISEISKGLSGAAAMGLGYWLARIGLITPSGADNAKERNFDTLLGEQDYSLNIGNYSYTLDWTGAGMLPIFMGAEINKLSDENGWSLNNVMTAISRVSEPLFDTTMLQGLNSAISSAAWGSEAQLTNFGTQATQNFMSQVVPTLSGQIARAVDDTRRTTYTDKTGIEGALDKTLQQARNKTPGLSQNSVPYLDMWGNEVKNTGGNFLGRLAYNTLSPGFLQKKSGDNVDMRVKQAYEQTKSTSVLPVNNTKTVSIDGERKRLNKDEFVQFKETKGNAMYNTISKIPHGLYSNLDNEQASKAYRYMYDYAAQKAKKEVFGVATDNWITTAEEYASKKGMDKFEAIAEFAIIKAAISNAEGKKDRNGETIPGTVKQARLQAIQNLGYNTYDANVLYKLLY